MSSSLPGAIVEKATLTRVAHPEIDHLGIQDAESQDQGVDGARRPNLAQASVLVLWVAIFLCLPLSMCACLCV